MTAPRLRILLSAYQCAPGQGSVSQIGWEWYSRLSARASVTLVTHSRNRDALEQAGVPLSGSEVIYIDTEWFAGRLHRAAKMIFPKSEHSVILLSSLDYFVYDHATLRLLQARAAEWDAVHVVTPVSPSAFTVLTKLGLPTVRGPLNGGLRSPANFAEFMRADSAWIYPIREIGRPLRALLAPSRAPNVTLTSNAATDRQLTARDRSRSVRLQEIAVDANLYRPAPWPCAPSASQPLRILFVGRLIPAKALPLLFRAMRRVQGSVPLELRVIGDGPMRSEWEAGGADLGTSVRFLGALPQRDVAQHLAQSHVLCLPSVRESGGAVLLEAMSAARPVIAVDYGGPAEIVSGEFGNLVSAASPEAVISGIAAALEDIVRNPELWRNRGIAGRRHILASHTWDARIDEGMAIYRKLCPSSVHSRSKKAA